VLASTLLRAAPVAVAAMLLALPCSALGASHKTRAIDAAPWVTDGFGSSSAALLTGRSSFSGQHGPASDHLPAVRENVELVGKLEMDTPDRYKEGEFQADVLPGQIADLAVYKNTAYLNSWSEPSCERGGFFSVDISNPAQPQQLAFVPAREDTYHGEGAHAITLATGPSAGRDILAVNNEPCSAGQPDDILGVGGFELYDVTNPASPVWLTKDTDPVTAGDQAPGDKSPDEPEDSSHADTTQDPAEVPNSNHSIFAWQDKGKAYVVIVDNTELHDVDIFDITNPRAPKFIADLDLVVMAEEQGIDIIGNSANGNAIFHHDMVVKKIGNVQTMLVSYWDAGYIKLNVNDPANPKIIGDSDFGTTDPLTGRKPPEGNGHEAEFSHDNRYVLAADEDFSTYRLPKFELTDGPHAGEYPAGEFGFTKPMASLDDNTLNGPTLFGGYGCSVDNKIPTAPGGLTLGPDEESIIVLSRGPQSATADPSAPYPACTFQQKAENAAAKGWDAVIIGNHHTGSGNGTEPDAALCGSGTFADIIAVCLGHRAMHFLFDDPEGTRPEDYSVPYDNTKEPQVGDVGARISTESLFDGWGYTHLYRNTGSDLEAVDHFAIEEALDERYAFGFGDLTVHEFATDPDTNVAYSSYYGGGMRVFTFGEDGLSQTGKFIDDGGNNFWGVEVVTTDQGERLFAGSDRDYGLYLLRYTGPGAPPTPAPSGGGGAGGPAAGGAPGAGAPGGGTLKTTGCENRFLGTPARDLITGTEGSDQIRTAAGDDVIDARAGDDCLFGDEGADVIDGESGNDRLEGSVGDDRLLGNEGDDVLIGAGGVDRLSGDDGDDRLSGGAKRDILAGHDGVDVLFGGSGRDGISGGRGNDRISGGSGADRITPGGGADRVIAAGGNDRIRARDGRKDRISCGSGRDTVTADRIDVLTGCERVTRR
jgi:hypothetical protein